jgi:hypothetical protein
MRSYIINIQFFTRRTLNHPLYKFFENYLNQGQQDASGPVLLTLKNWLQQASPPVQRAGIISYNIKRATRIPINLINYPSYSEQKFRILY